MDTTTNDEPALAVEGLSVELATDDGWVRVVDDLSFTVDTGTTLGIVGESGSGKTVTSLALMGLLPRRGSRIPEGSVRLGGTELVDLPLRQLEDRRGNDIAMVFQEPMTSLNPAFTIGDQIGETVRRHRGGSRRAARQVAVEALRRVGIPGAERRVRSYPHELSGGLRQRAMIAMATCCDPQVLIADEPTTALDVTIQAQVLDLLRSMRDDLGMALVFITHDLGVVADICDRVLVMYGGQAMASDRVVGTFHDPPHPYAEGLLASMPQVGTMPQELATVPGQAPHPGRLPTGCRFHPRCPYAEDRCRTSEIPLQDLGGGRTSRCLRIGELALEGSR